MWRQQLSPLSPITGHNRQSASASTPQNVHSQSHDGRHHHTKYARTASTERSKCRLQELCRQHAKTGNMRDGPRNSCCCQPIPLLNNLLLQTPQLSVLSSTLPTTFSNNATLYLNLPSSVSLPHKHFRISL